MRLCLLIAILALTLPASALAQGDSFGPLPAAPPSETPVPTVTPTSSVQDESTGSRTVLLIGGGLVALFLVIGTVIVRDARRNVPEDQLRQRERDQGPHKHERQAKAKARAKARAARRARKKTVRNR